MLIIILFIILFFIILFFIIIYFYSNKDKLKSYNDKKRSGYGEGEYDYNSLMNKITLGSVVTGSDGICNGTGRAMIRLKVEENNNIALGGQFGEQYLLKVRYLNKTANSEWVSSINLDKEIDHIIFKKADNEEITLDEFSRIVNSLSVNATGFEANNLIPDNFEAVDGGFISKEAFKITNYKYFFNNPPLEIIYQLPYNRKYIESKTDGIILLNIPFKIKIESCDEIPSYLDYETVQEAFEDLTVYLFSPVNLDLFKEDTQTQVYTSLFTITLPDYLKDGVFINVVANDMASKNYYKCKDGKPINFKKSDVDGADQFYIDFMGEELTCI